MNTASKKLQNSANNLANIQTPGFKSSRVDTTSLQSGGVVATSTSRSTAQGPVMTTSNSLDLSINGSGFFRVALPNGGEGFTRSGSFKTAGDGRIVTSDGNPIAPEIAIPGNSAGISVGAGGDVSAVVDGNPVNVGQLQLASFNNPAGLTPLGGSLFAESAASGQAVVGNPGTGQFGSVLSGALEGSSVDIASEMVDQIIARVAFKANINVIKTANEMTGAILNIKA